MYLNGHDYQDDDSLKSTTTINLTNVPDDEEVEDDVEEKRDDSQEKLDSQELESFSNTIDSDLVQRAFDALKKENAKLKSKFA